MEYKIHVIEGISDKTYEWISSTWYLAINTPQIGNFIDFRGKNLFSKLHLSFIINIYSGQPCTLLKIALETRNRICM